MRTNKTKYLLCQKRTKKKLKTIIRGIWKVFEMEKEKEKKKGIRGKENINKIKSYLRDIIIDLQSSDTWKIQLTIAINFISSKNTEEECVMNSTRDNI